MNSKPKYLKYLISYNTFDVNSLQHSVSQSVQKSVQVLLHSPDSGALSCIFKAGSHICIFPVSSLDSLKEIRTECEKSFSTEYYSDYKAGSALVRVNLFLEKKDTWSSIRKKKKRKLFFKSLSLSTCFFLRFFLCSLPCRWHRHL